MSCNNPGTGKADLMPRKPKYDKDPVCVRCRNKDIPASIIVRHSVYCRSCFLTSLGHRFRKSLEPTINPPEVKPPPGPRRIPLRPVLKASGNLLLAFSGGPASSLLLDLIHESYFTPAQLDPARGTKQKSKRENVWPVARVAFIDMSAAYPGTPDRTEDARRLVVRYPHFEFVPLRIEYAFDPSWAASVGFPLQGAFGVDLRSEDLPAVSSAPDAPPAVALAAYLSSQPSSSARTTALRTLTRLLLQYTARHTESSHLLLGTSLTSYAVDLLDAVAIGAGFAIRQVGEETWEDIRIVRPLREITDKEVAAGVWWRRIEVMPASIGGGVLTPKESGITKLTKEFITGLDRDFPSTVHTIARTCEKLAPTGGTAARCPLCERPVQPGVQTWKAQIAIREFDAESKSTPAESLLEATELLNVDPGANSNVPLTLLSSPALNPDASRAPEPRPSGGTDGTSSLANPSPNPAPSLDSTRPSPDVLETSPDALAPSLCYACHTQLTSRGRVPGKATGPADRGESVTLPVWVRPNLEQNSGVGLPQDVRKYLLDES